MWNRLGVVEAQAREGHGQARSLLPADHAVVARRQLASAIADKLLALARRAPVVLVVEDLHHAAEGALDLLHDLLEALERADGRRPVLVATARPAWRERLDAAPSARERIARRPLDGLEPAAVRQIAAEMLAVEPPDVPEPLASELVEVCDGNPIWVQSAVRTVVDRGHLRPVASGWVLTGAELSSVLHVAIGDLLHAELAGLASSTRAVLAVAALIGGRSISTCSVRPRASERTQPSTPWTRQLAPRWSGASGAGRRTPSTPSRTTSWPRC
ncbi:hypothetical protein [Sorangium sp. So ce381]|uniref:hypothetical protein n=1 Tax=Sorangium sp. So ce381 TaxID=3133307 RepID=UPI003F5B0466